MYYYLVASLPLLTLDVERFWSADEFLGVCRSNLSARDFRLVSAASLTELGPTQPACRTLELWRAWEICLRSELAALRGKRAGREQTATRLEAQFALSAQNAARAAFGQESPLQAEEMLERARWAHLDDLEVGHHFDVDKVVIYHLRLQLLGRRALRDPVRGEERFSESFETITEAVHGSG